MNQDKLTTILLAIAGVILIFVMISLCRSSFVATTKTVGTTQAPTDAKVAVILMDGCPHCEKMKKAAMDAAKETRGKLLVVERADPVAQKLQEKFPQKGFPAIIDVSTGESLPTDRTRESLVNLVN